MLDGFQASVSRSGMNSLSWSCFNITPQTETSPIITGALGYRHLRLVTILLSV